MRRACDHSCGAGGGPFLINSNSSPAKCAVHFLANMPGGIPLPSVANSTLHGVIAEHNVYNKDVQYRK